MRHPKARGLFGRLIDSDEFAAAAVAAVRGKRRRPDVAWFLFRRESVLAEIRDSIAAAKWRPRGFDLLFVRDPKPRVIARAPIEDRVVHTALVRQMEPVLTRSLTDDVYACRRGRGTHRAVLRLLELMRRHRFVVHLDVASYFASIDVERLRGLVHARITDSPFLAIVDQVLDSGRGLFDAPAVRRFARMSPEWPPPRRCVPIGALTSQLFAAHVYLDAFDHFVKRSLHVPGYVRYVDDLFLFGDRRAELRAWRTQAAEWLERERGLRLKAPNARILSCHGHLDALGQRLTREGIAPLPRRSLRRLTAGVAAWVRGSAQAQRVDAQASLASATAHYFFGC